MTITTDYPSTPQRQWKKLAHIIALSIHSAFERYHEEFEAITERTKVRFVQRDWRGGQADAVERLLLYTNTVQQVTGELRTYLGEETLNKEIWHAARDLYAGAIARRKDSELAETFFNSVTRRIFVTVGVDANTEFVWFGAKLMPTGEETPIYRVYICMTTIQAVITGILADYRFAAPYADLNRDAALVAAGIEEHLQTVWQSPVFDAIEMVSTIFYRNKGAYLVGRIRKRDRLLPLLLPLIHTEEGIVVDNVLLTEREAHRVFSHTHSYFHVETQRPAPLVGFLKSIMPAKPTSEIYTAIGYHKHGKTLLYQELYQHLNHSIDKFEIARGVRGMVMSVFTLPSFDLVFKVIRDRFAAPKMSTREQVKERYRLVFRHDRVGRMVDAQEFEYLAFSRDRFSQALLDELRTEATETVTLTEDEVIFKHLYTERRLYPLDLYIKEMSFKRAASALVDYGNALHDLAGANIFPGDIFLKNFGVTSQGRVILYDYDEVCLLTDCNFRTFPPARSYDDEIAAEPWFAVNPNDIFPEEFRTFLWFPEPLRKVMEETHAALYTAQFWQTCQASVHAGEVLDIYPYEQNKQFRAAQHRAV